MRVKNVGLGRSTRAQRSRRPGRATRTRSKRGIRECGPTQVRPGAECQRSNTAPQPWARRCVPRQASETQTWPSEEWLRACRPRVRDGTSGNWPRLLSPRCRRAPCATDSFANCSSAGASFSCFSSCGPPERSCGAQQSRCGTATANSNSQRLKPFQEIAAIRFIAHLLTVVANKQPGGPSTSYYRPNRRRCLSDPWAVDAEKLEGFYSVVISASRSGAGVPGAGVPCWARGEPCGTRFQPVS